MTTSLTELPSEQVEDVKRGYVQRIRRARRRRDESALAFPEWLLVAQPRLDWSYPHMQLLAQELDKLRTGETKQLIVTAPPRHGKSTLGTILFPPYMLEQEPTQQIAIGCFNATLAEKFGRRGLQLAQRRLPTLNPKRQTAADWETIEGGYVRSVGVGNPPMGEGFNGLIVDDPFKGKVQAESPAYREKVWTWFEADLLSRLEPNGWILVTHTRWNDDDLIGRILEGEHADGWTVVNMPALAEPGDLLGREPGEALWPERWPREELERRWRDMSPGTIAALYQQSPVSPQGHFFNVDEIRVIDEADVPKALPVSVSFKAYERGEKEPDPPLMRCARAYDLAGTADVRADYTVGTLLAGPDMAGRYYVLDVLRVQLEPRERDALIIATAGRDGTATRIRMPRDRKGDFGRAIVKNFVDMLEGYTVQCKEPKGSKALRSEPLQSAISHGKIVLVRSEWPHFHNMRRRQNGHSARQFWFHELRSFRGDGDPKKGAASSARHDDLVDSLADAHAACALRDSGITVGDYDGR